MGMVYLSFALVFSYANVLKSTLHTIGLDTYCPFVTLTCLLKTTIGQVNIFSTKAWLRTTAKRDRDKSLARVRVHHFLTSNPHARACFGGDRQVGMGEKRHRVLKHKDPNYCSGPCFSKKQR